MDGIADFTEGMHTSGHDRDHYALLNVEYTTNNGQTVVHLIGRDEDGQRTHVEVIGHNPSLFVPRAQHNQRLDNHYAVDRTEHGHQSLMGNALTRVYTNVPDSVPDVRELFDETWEADVFYTNRFLLDTGIWTGFAVPTDVRDRGAYHGDIRVGVSDVEPSDEVALDPRLCVVDIEVAASDDSVPESSHAEAPVSSLVAFDSYRGVYIGWILEDDSASSHGSLSEAIDGDEVGCDDVRTFTDESSMLDDFNRFIEQTRPDLLSGWFSDDFDYPYLINRCRNLNVYSYRDWSPFGDVWVSNRFQDPCVKGVTMFDGLPSYQKTQIHKLEDKSLEAVSQRELGVGKLDKDGLSYTELWLQKPTKHLSYNQTDVQRVVEILDEQSIVPLFNQLREVTGAQYEDCYAAINLIDMLMLRESTERGFRLPSATKPDKDWFYGAHVVTPKAGLHEHVVYPDYSSLYPNMMYQCNISPETIIGTADDLAQSEYDEDDCVWSYIDTRPVEHKKDDDPSMTKCYYVKPSIKEGFVREVIEKILVLTQETSGKRREALKRVRNAVWGVLGDSKSFGTGFRLYDWRLAESTTLGGQRVLKEGADKFIEMANDDCYDEYRDTQQPCEVVGGDTDSVMTAFEAASSPKDAVDWALDVTERVNEWLPQHSKDTFNVAEDDCRMELELESYSTRLFFPAKNPPIDPQSDAEGVKKRYASAIGWDEGTWLEEPELNVKGFEYVRSDVATVTKNVQYDVLTDILTKPLNEAQDNAYERVNGVYNSVYENEFPMDDLGVPFGISQTLDSYGSSERRPQPQYRGAKYANRYLYGDTDGTADSTAISEGDKPLLFYVDTVGDGYPSTYTAETAEDGTMVDAVSVLDADDMPGAIDVDGETMLSKTVEKPLKPIFGTLGWDFDEALRDGEQATLDASNFM
jgi:DNA polymerase elongation subunit (family B)